MKKSSIDKNVEAHVFTYYSYRDEQSFDEDTRKIKPKYKIACQPVASSFVFIILNSKNYSCNLASTFTIDKDEWEEREPNELTNISYCAQFSK